MKRLGGPAAEALAALEHGFSGLNLLGARTSEGIQGREIWSHAASARSLRQSDASVEARTLGRRVGESSPAQRACWRQAYGQTGQLKWREVEKQLIYFMRRGRA
jgi:hypothetical protein